MEEKPSEDFQMIAKTMFGLEEILAAELLKLGAREIEPLNRAVSFVGDKGFMYKANLCLRTALKILKPIATFKMHDEIDLYKKISKIPWEEYLTVDDSIVVDSVLNSEVFTHTQFISQKTKDAIVDRFREKFEKRPSVDKDNPDLRINIHVFNHDCTVSLDSSGESLHKRGYKVDVNKAPMNEVLAAGLVMMSGWEKHRHFVDPMCGTGTLLIEAALWANNIPPGYYRDEFAFERWKDFDKELFDMIYNAAIAKIKNDVQNIRGGDASRNVIRIAKNNVLEAKLEDTIRLEVADFENFQPDEGRGVVIMNPPYGERMNKDDSEALYKSIGDTLKKNFNGYDAWIISSNMEALKNVGLRPSRKIKLFNGALECRFMKYEMYSGTKKIHKLKEKS